MAQLQIAHTSQLDAQLLAAIRTLLDAAFIDDPLDEHNWDHALGGMHVIVWEGDVAVGHASVVQRRLLYGGRALRAGYVEAVGVHPHHQRRGHGRTLMAAINDVIRQAYELGALAGSEMGRPLYLATGWIAWSGTTSSLTPHGIVRTPDDDDCLFVFPVSTEVDPSTNITCDWRDGDVW